MQSRTAHVRWKDLKQKNGRRRRLNSKRKICRKFIPLAQIEDVSVHYLAHVRRTQREKGSINQSHPME